MTDSSILSSAITFTLLLLMLTYVNVFMVFILRKKRYQHYAEKQRWTNFVLEERDRLMSEIARDVHDNLGQRIFLLYKTYDRMFQDISKEEHLRLRRNAAELIDQLSGHVRNINNTLNNDYIRARGLEEVLRRDIDRVSAAGLYECHLDVSGEPPQDTDAEKELMVYRIVQEAMHNAMKHADCNTLVFSLAFRGNGFEFELEDNGKGFDMVTAIQKQRMGLLNMNKRAERLGATLEVRSKLGCGTKVRLHVPDISKQESVDR